MQQMLSGKTALITGGSSGIGLATARRFVSEGANVVIAARDEVRVEAATRELGEGAVGICVDLRSVAGLDAMFDTLRAHHSRLDVVFANAGSTEPQPLGEITEADWDREFDLNVKGIVFLIQKALPMLADGGAIVLTTSIANVKGLPGATAYSASKAAVRTFARTWTSELRSRGIRVNAVSPGPIDTPLHNGLGADDPQMRQRVMAMVEQIPVGRIGRPDDVASAVTFLASDQATFITGVELSVDGGLTQI